MDKLGVLYGGGKASPRITTRRQWFEKAADAGDIRGMNNLGSIYENAMGGAQDNASVLNENH
jgi:TPR repeat protein